MAPPMQSSLEQRPGPYLNEEYGRRWMAMLERRGYFYLGSEDKKGTLRVLGWRPNRVLAVDPHGNTSVWENACRHHGYPLIQASNDLVYHPWDDRIKCPWHGMEYSGTGEVLTPGLIPIKLADLPERQCPVMEIFRWRGLVFELGRSSDRARKELRESLDELAEMAGSVFDFRDYALQVSLGSPQPLADACTSVDNFLDVTHVGRHRGTLVPLVNLRSYAYEPKDGPPRKSVAQFMELRDEWMNTKWGKLYQQSNLPPPPYGAVWWTSRMGLMLEYYPGVIVVSQCLPHPEKWWECMFWHDFYYQQGSSSELINHHQTIFKETGDEDLVWCSGATQHIRDRIASGRAHEPWGFFDPKRENFGTWYAASARELLELE